MPGEHNYVIDRLEEQSNWHSKKARKYKAGYHITDILALIAGALIPVINVGEYAGIGPFSIKMLSAILGATMLISVGIAKIYNFQQTWLNYRAVSEELNRQKFLYLSKVAPYDVENGEERTKILVQQVERVLGSKTAEFIRLHSKDNDETAGNPINARR